MKCILTRMTLTWHGCTIWVVTSLSLCLVACGGGTSFDATNNPAAAPSIASFSTATAAANAPTSFLVTGSNIPSTVSAELSSGSCATPTAVTANSFSVVCTPAPTSGPTYLYVYSKSRASGGSWLGQQQLTVSVSAPANTITRLTDTGIGTNQCFGAGSDALIDCASAAASALNSQQDGMVGRDAVATVNTLDGWLGFSYGVFAAECFQDNVTGLIWQKASTTLSYVIAAATNPITLAFDAVTVANANAMCGNTGWRLPTREELQSLLHYGSTSSIAVDLGALGLTKGTSYLSGDSYLMVNRSYWSVDFAQGSTGSAAGTTYELRLVRGTSATGSWTLSPDGTEVTDSRTGLTWQRCTVGQSWNGSACVGLDSRFSHEQALSLAKTLQNAQTPWRLPNVKELSSLVSGSFGMAIDTTVFAGTQNVAGYWTSTPNVRSFGSAWSVSFNDGTASPVPRSNPLFVRLVR